MGKAMLGGSGESPAATVATRRLCDSTLDQFESDDTTDRTRAVAMCAQCPLLELCEATTLDEINRGIGPTAVVRAGVAWNYDGQPDPAIHASAPDWISDHLQNREPAAAHHSDSDIVDLFKVELVFFDPARVRQTLTDREIDEVIREGARRKVSLNFLSHALKLHWRKADQAAKRLGIRDAFATKRRRAPKPSTSVDAPVPAVHVSQRRPVRTPAAVGAINTAKAPMQNWLRTISALHHRPRAEQLPFPPGLLEVSPAPRPARRSVKRWLSRTFDRHHHGHRGYLWTTSAERAGPSSRECQLHQPVRLSMIPIRAAPWPARRRLRAAARTAAANSATGSVRSDPLCVDGVGVS